MFLTKRNKNYYVYFINEHGKKNKVSCKTSIKSDALKFLSNFESELNNRKKEKFESIRIKDYFDNYLLRNRQFVSYATKQNYEVNGCELEK
jgi:hypothetical protein